MYYSAYGNIPKYFQDFPRGPAHHEYREKFIRRRLQRMGSCRRTRRFAERDKRDGRREDEFLVNLLMSPVSPVFHTEATVSIGLKNVFRVGTAILQYCTRLDVDRQSAQNSTFNSPQRKLDKNLTLLLLSL